MCLLEFILGLVVAVFIYKNTWRFGDKGTFFKCLSLIFFIQLIVYVKRDASVESVQFSVSQIVPFLFTALIVPFYEECIYRGCLVDFFHGLFKSNLVIPVMLSSVIFSGMHTQYSGILDFSVLFIVSLILSFARFKSGSLLPSMLLHSSMNAFVLVLNFVSSK
ncbi:CPBP family intramembrane glutamic endopeptidase [Kosakonia quasisacchari]